MIGVPRLLKQLSILDNASKATAKGIPLQQKSLDAKLPRVDIFITHCGEGTEIALNTARAACVQDFPPSLIRVIILDDSHSTQLEDAVSALRNSNKHPNLYYASRDVQVSTHSKAGNLNFGLQFVSTLPGPAPDYISVLDVDMISTPQWLKTVIAPLLHDPSAALACTSQRFYNIPTPDFLGMTYELQYIGCFVYMQNAAQEAWCTGSGFAIRRTALEQIGGFPEECIQEDIMTSLFLHGAGWKTLSHDDPLQWGLAADTMTSWIKQRQRWAAGMILVSRFVCTPRARQLPFPLRLKAFLWGVTDAYASFIWTLSMFVFPLAVATGKPLVPRDQLGFHLRLAALDFVGQSMSSYLLLSLINFGGPILDQVSSIWTTPFRFAMACKYIVPGILGRPLPRSKPTGLPGVGDAERAARRKGTSCLRAVVWGCGGWIHVLCLGACLAGVGASVGEVVRVFGRTTSQEGNLRWPLQAAFDALIVRIGWPPLFLLLTVFIRNAWTPIGYGISPPPLVDSKEVLRESAETGVQYPTEWVKRESMKRPSQSFWWSIAIFYGLVVVIAEVTDWHA